ncbi:hypothetical protein DXG01_005496 [Tephrocybe rancida]|nr:hypothetical protein DXG01_005496 [Tephrocybe rancida]
MAKAFRRFGLASSSQVPTDVVKTNVAPTLSADAKKFGLENALYFCTPFRDLMLQSPDASLTSTAPQPAPATPATPATPLAPVRRKPERKQSTTTTPAPEPILPPAVPIPPAPPSLFSALRSLFLYISTHPQERGTVSPRAFIDKLKEVNRVFDTTTHQDAHEFLNYLLNKIVEEVEEEHKALDAPEDCKLRLQLTVPLLTPKAVSNSITTLPSQAPSSSSSPQHSTLVHRLFEGVLTSETRCLTCETNSSVTACLRQFSASEMLCHKNKFFCDSCCDLQEAEKRMKIKRLPNVLALHLKRFKYQEETQRYVKLAYRVAFPFELRLFNTVDEMDDADRLYNLFGIVVHIGNGPHHGHYISIVKTLGTWLLFDDENVSPIPESDIPKYFGDAAPAAGCAYVLYYQAADIDMGKLGLRPEQAEEFRSTTAAELSQPSRPPGLAPEDVAPIPTPSESSSSSEIGQPPSLPPPSSSSLLPTQPIPIPIPSAPSLRRSASTSASSSHHSHSHTRSTDQQTHSKSSPPAAPPLTNSLSSPAPAKPTAASLFKTIRKSPSLAIRTSIGQSSAVGMATPTAAAHNVPALPPTPTRVPVNGTEASPESPTSTRPPLPFGNTKPAVRPTTAHGNGHSNSHVSSPRALPVPPRPVTSGDPDGENERDKEGGWGRWFGGGGGRSTEPTVLVTGVADAETLGSRWSSEGGDVSGDVDPNTSTHVNGSANGVATTGSKKKDKEHKEKEKGKTWFTKRKSFRLGGEKTPKEVVNTPDAEPPADSSVWHRSSLQPQRRVSESGDRQAAAPPPLMSVRSTPGLNQQPPPSPSTSKHRPRPVSTTLKKDKRSSHLHPQDQTSVNGEVSPTASSMSSTESGSISVGTSTSVMPPVPPSPHHIPHTHQYQHQHQHPSSRPHHHNIPNGHPPPSQPLPPPPVPRLHSSVSNPPSAPPTNALPKPPRTPTSPYPHPRTLPIVPQSPGPPPPPTPERKKSIASFPVFRGREKEKEKAPVSPRPSTAGHEVGRERERPLPLPPLPVTDSVELRTHKLQPQRLPQHQRHGSVLGGVEVEEPADDSPGLASFGSANTSATSSVSNGGNGNNGFKRATRKLSLSAPMLGFGKRDKDKDRERSKEKAAPSSFARV